MQKLAIIISTTRDARFGEKAARWVYDLAVARKEFGVELIDLREYKLPFFNEVASSAWVPSTSPEAQRWQKKVAEFDAYLFVTAEYNRSIPAVLKNALDYAYTEWNRKPAAFVGYGSVGAARAIEHLRTICVELQMAPMRTAVHIMGADFMGVWKQGKRLEDLAHLQPSVKDMFDQLAWWSATLKAGREARPVSKAA